MRPLLIIGILLAALGAFVIFRGLHYSREESVLKIGDLEAKVRQEHTVPEWIGGIALGAGLVLVVASFRRR
jgi:hypothetical protein